MKIAVNARPLLTPLTGIGRYIRGLMQEVERDGRYAPDYFYATHWSRELRESPALLFRPSVVGFIRSMGPLRPWVREIQRRNFAAGLRRGDHALYFEPNYLPLPSDLPTVITIHDLSHLRHPETHPVARVHEMERLLAPAVEKAACILTVSEFTRSEVIATFGAKADRVVATPLGADARFFPRAAEATAETLKSFDLTHGRYFLAVGTLEPRKNVLTTLEAHARLPQRVRSAFPLVVVGMSGWLCGNLSRELESARSRGDVRLLGHVADAALPLLYAGAAMLCYPSLYEGFGLPLLEAMASGVPVAASDRASLPEVVGDAGVLVDPFDTEGLKAAMLRVVDDAAFAADLSARGVERAKAFSWRRCAELTLRAWDGVIKASP